MSETQKARMQQKRDTNEKWNQASGKNFVPKPGELIIINDNLENQVKGEGAKSIVKVGDGKTPMEKLQGITGEVYVQSEEPQNAGEGAVWFSFDDTALDGSGEAAVADWDAQIGEDGYILNKPVSDVTRHYSYACESLAANDKKQITSQVFQYLKMKNIQVTLSGVTDYQIITKLYTKSEAEDFIQNSLSGPAVMFVRGSDWFISTTSVVILYAVGNGYSSTAAELGIITDSNCDYKGEFYEKGIHFLATKEGYYISSFEFNYTDLEFDEDYKDIFKDVKASNVYKIDLNEFLDEEISQNLVALLIAEIGKYKAGDILLVPSALLELLE